MYIDPFIAGVLTTIFVEVTAIIIGSIWGAARRGEYDDE